MFPLIKDTLTNSKNVLLLFDGGNYAYWIIRPSIDIPKPSLHYHYWEAYKMVLIEGRENDNNLYY
jgi:hypothetical protein